MTQCFLLGKGLRIPCNAAVSWSLTVILFLSPLGQSNNNSDTCAEFRIKYVGAIEKLKISEGKNLEGPLDLINYIDVAQVKKKKKKKVHFCKILKSKLMALEKDVFLRAFCLILKPCFCHWYWAPWSQEVKGAGEPESRGRLTAPSSDSLFSGSV